MKISLSGVSDQELVSKLKLLAGKEREITHSVVNHLAEMIRRRLYAELGYASVFDYATRALGYSKASANRRTKAAKVIAQFPEVYQCLENGRLTLSVLEVVADGLGTENAREMLAEVEGKSRDEALRVVAAYFPVKESWLNDRITPIVVQTEAADCGDKDLFNSEEFTLVRSELNSNPVKKDEKVRIMFTAKRRVQEKLERAKELLFAAEGRATLEVVFERALDEYLKRNCPEEREKQRILKKQQRHERKHRRRKQRGENLAREVDALKAIAGQVVPQMPKADKNPANARYIPVKLRDKILKRDGHRCTYVAPDGTRCTARANLQMDHEIPLALGGSTTADNLRTACKTHNLMFARKQYGDDRVNEIIRQRKAGYPQPVIDGYTFCDPLEFLVP